MRNVNLTTPVTLTAILVATIALAQDPFRESLTMGMGDVAVIKQKAEVGDAAAQVAFGGTLTSRFHASEALARPLSPQGCPACPSRSRI